MARSSQNALLVLTVLTVLTAGCTDNGGAGAETDGPSDDSSSGETGSESSGDANPEPDIPPPWEPSLARAIDITTVEANQGVAVPIGRDGRGLGGDERNAYLVANRNLLIRAHYDVSDDWTPRELEAKLTLSWADGSSRVATKTFMIDSDSVMGDLDRTLWWYVPAELVKSGLEYAIEVYETQPGFEDEPEGIARVPLEGSAFVGIETSYMVLKVVVVPIHHDTGTGNCAAAPTLDQEALDFFASDLEEQNPVERVEVTAHDVYTYTESMDSFVGLLGELRDLRNADMAPPDVYYYGVVRPCDGGPNGIGGQAIDIPNNATQGNWYTRIAVGRWQPGSLGATSGTLVHEIGHTQGRRHILCNGDEGGPDPSYPYEAGAIGVWGFGISRWTLHGSTIAKDYMTYCSNTWVSDWGWNKVYPFIEEISSWELAGRAPELEGAVLVGTVSPDGTETWTTLPGSVAQPMLSLDHSVEFYAESKLLVEVPAVVSKRPHDETLNVYVPLPATFADATSIVHVQNGVRVATLRRAIRIRHELGLATSQ